MSSLPIFPTPRPGGLPGLRFILGHCLLFALGLLGTSQLLRAGLELQPALICEPLWRSQKLLTTFLETKDELDLVFVGSSRFMRGIDPAVFDEETVRAGTPLKSFSYSMNGMLMPEIIARVDWIIAQEPDRLRYLLIELTSLDPIYREQNRLGRRMIDWHTGRASLDSVRMLLGSDREIGSKLEEGSLHLAEYGLRFGNLGLSSVIAKNWNRLQKSKPSAQVFTGFSTPKEIAARVRVVNSSERKENLRKRVEKRGKPKPKQVLRDDFPAVQERVLREFMARVSAAGIELVFVMTPAPSVKNAQGFSEDRTGSFAGAKGVLSTALFYADRRRFAPLYDPANFVDSQHLSSRGAKLFSKRLAFDFLNRFDLDAGGD